MNQSPLNSGLGLAETIREIGSEEAVVAVDAANVHFWQPSAQKGPVPGGLSLCNLANYLKEIEAVKKRYLFTARYSFNHVFIQRIIRLVENIEPGDLRRAQVNDKHGETYEYEGKVYDLELLMIVANELISKGKVDELRENISTQIYYVTNQVRSNKSLLKRERQGYEVITTDYRVYKNAVTKMAMIGNLAKNVEIADFRENGSFNQMEVAFEHPNEKGVSPLKRNLELAEKKFDELVNTHELTELEDLKDKFKKMLMQVDQIDEELKRRDKDILSLEKLEEKQSYKIREIMQIADKATNTLVSKGNVDSFLVASLMDRKVMDKADTFVVFSGDGDFRLMYEKMLEADKRVVVVSPLEYLNGNLKQMISSGKISLVNPNQDLGLWKPRIGLVGKSK